MLNFLRNTLDYRDLVLVLAWKSFAVRYKQSYLGILWSVLKPLTLVLMFVIVRAFVGIDSGNIPYPLLTFVALMPWIFFQEATSEGVTSVVANAALIRKVYFPREVFPVTTVATKTVELAINFLIAIAMMRWYDFMPGVQALWVPVLVLYTALASLSIVFVGAALHVRYRDVGAALPIALSFAMYVSPIIYPLSLVRDKLLVAHAAGSWSEALFTLYTANPITGIIDAFQAVLLRNAPPDWSVMAPGAVVVAIALPISYAMFKRAESYFADVV